MRQITITACLLFLTACATSGQIGLLDFNEDFKQSIPTNPQYKIETVGVNRFQVVVYQGSALLSERTTRAAFLTRAGLIAMEAHCLKRGGLLGTYSFRDNVDSLGYINVLGFFTCNVPATPREPNDSTTPRRTDI